MANNEAIICNDKGNYKNLLVKCLPSRLKNGMMKHIKCVYLLSWR